MDAPYLRLAATLRRHIADGDWPPGTRLPSAREIAEQFDYPRNVAQRALSTLHAEGLAEGKRGARLVVAGHPVEVSILDDADADWPHGRGDAERSTVRADETLAERLNVPVRTVLHRERVELLDARGRPAMVLTTWRQGRARRHATYGCVLRLDALSAADAALLGLAAGIPVLVVERTRYDAEDAVVQVADLVLPADRWHVSW